ncbi:hypothetical protein LIG30_1683 [Burkholderia sp. lig30]|nr:hypothetical protein LIG30_1683 [Burkholderia sp. lig30]
MKCVVMLNDDEELTFNNCRSITDIGIFPRVRQAC